MCEIGAIMRKDELYARGWIRLYERESTRKAIEEMAHYLMGITKMQRSHIERCEECAEAYDRTYGHKHQETCPECK